MNTALASQSVESSRSSRLLLPALVGGCTAATLDITSAIVNLGWEVPKHIAAHLVGPGANQGGAGFWLLGMALHFFILIVAAGIYGIASRHWTFLRVNWILFGIYYGISIWLFMNLILLPLTPVPHTVAPFQLSGMLNGLIGHIVIVGLPISASFRFLGKSPE